jgi:hypothetical protein
MRRKATRAGAFAPRPPRQSGVRMIRVVRLNGEVLERYVGADSVDAAYVKGLELFPNARSVEIVRAKKVPVGNPTRGRIWESIDPRGNVQGRG